MVGRNRARRAFHGRAGLVAALGLLPALVAAQARAPASDVRVGHWLEVEGALRPDGVFVGGRAEVKEPDRHELLIGTASGVDRGRGRFEVLGQPVTLSGDTELEGLTIAQLDGEFVEVEGVYEGPQELEADEVELRPREADRIGGRVDEISESAEGTLVRIMRYWILLPPTVEHEEPLDSLPLAPAREIDVEGDRGVDEDDLFGRGIRLSDTLRLAGQVELEAGVEDNFDLDSDDPEDLEEQEAGARLRLIWRPRPTLYGVADVRAIEQRQDDEEDGSSTSDQLRAGQVYLYYHHPHSAFDLQLGRQDFDDEREWLYDRNLDGLRFIKGFFPWRLELSATTTLADGSARDEDAINWIGYLAREWSERHLGIFVVHRRIEGDFDERPTHVGLRALTEEGWADVAWLTGEADGEDLGGWGLDLGRTLRPPRLRPLSFTVAYAFGSGGGDQDELEGTFRQTGFHDNNGKFAGVTSFRYYGELIDPELANLHIGTLGIGGRVARRASLDLVGHYYRQDELSDELLGAELDEDPDGEHEELGWELDLVYGDRRLESFDFEVVGAWFLPGDAFPDQDDALLGRVQVRYRF